MLYYLKSTGDLEYASSLLEQATKMYDFHYQKDPKLDYAKFLFFYHLILSELKNYNQSFVILLKSSEMFLILNSMSFIEDCDNCFLALACICLQENLIDLSIEIHEKLLANAKYNKIIHQNLAVLYHIKGIECGDNSYIIKANEQFIIACESNGGLSIKVEYVNFLRKQKRYDEALELLDSKLFYANEENHGELHYGFSEIVTLPTELGEEIKRNNKPIKIENPIFFAHYLKILCLIETHDYQIALIEEALSDFRNFVIATREHCAKPYLPIYDWFLEKATDLASPLVSQARTLKF